MNTLLLYLAKTILVSGFLFAYYRVFLRNASFHVYNRTYLLGITFIAMLLPLIQLRVAGSPDGGGSPRAIGVLHRITAGKWEEMVDPGRHPALWGNLLNGQVLLFSVWVLVAAFFLTSFFRTLRYIRRLSAKCPEERAGSIRIFLTTEPGTPFSFLNRIFWNDRLDLQSPEGKQVLRHELYHVRQKHTLDLLALEILRAVCWFNPFFHLIGREIKATHEFLADRYASTVSNKYEYAELLVWQTIANSSPSLVHSFFNTHLKRRISMLTRSTNHPPGYFSRLLILPLLFLLFCAFAIKLEKPPAPGAPLSEKTITVVIDAGHGGSDPGTHSAELKEKDLALQIAKKIKRLSPAYHINVLMTREEDELPGGASTAQEGLRNRADFANGHKADLFISIHINGTSPGDTTHGVQVWFSPQNTCLQKSLSLGSAMIEEMKKVYPTDEDLKHREEGIYVLRNSNMPAILLECGNMDNDQDLAFISKEQGQETIARTILQGILRYAESAVPAVAAVVPEVRAPAPSAEISAPPPPVPAAP